MRRGSNRGLRHKSNGCPLRRDFVNFVFSKTLFKLFFTGACGTSSYWLTHLDTVSGFRLPIIFDTADRPEHCF